jgi:RNA polymerase sigma-70 factor (ECF subfamily)
VEAGEEAATAGLVAGIQSGDPVAGEELIRRYSRAVTVLIRRSVYNHAHAEDLVQETFRMVIDKIRKGELREPERLSGFVRGIASNLVIELFRRESRRLDSEALERTRAVAGTEPSQLDELLRRENIDLVRRVLREMPGERDREVLYRFYLSEESKQQICDHLGLSSLQFDQVLFRARQRYRSLYEKAREKSREAR